MRMKSWFRVILMGGLIAALGIPSESWTALAQQEGPQSPAPNRAPAQPAPPAPGQSQGQTPTPAPPPQVAIAVQSNIVNVDAVVTDQDGNIVTGLKKENFRILDDGQRQQVANFAPTDAVITIVMLMEFSKRYGGFFAYQAKNLSYSFLAQLKPKDWVALKTFDLKTTLVEDFTQDKQEVGQAIASLYFPSFSEANLFDAVLETVGQLRDVKGKKAILVLATGFDTFSKHTLDETLRRLKENDVTIFCVGVAEDIDLYSRGGGGVGRGCVGGGGGVFGHRGRVPTYAPSLHAPRAVGSISWPVGGGVTSRTYAANSFSSGSRSPRSTSRSTSTHSIPRACASTRAWGLIRCAASTPRQAPSAGSRRMRSR